MGDKNGVDQMGKVLLQQNVNDLENLQAALNAAVEWYNAPIGTWVEFNRKQLFYEAAKKAGLPVIQPKPE